jgi:hypothetical protein
MGAEDLTPLTFDVPPSLLRMAQKIVKIEDRILAAGVRERTVEVNEAQLTRTVKAPFRYVLDLGRAVRLGLAVEEFELAMPQEASWNPAEATGRYVEEKTGNMRAFFPVDQARELVEREQRGEFN